MESLLLYINSIKFNRSLVDGPGVRTVVFFQGCDIRCKGCQNNSTWDMLQGTQMTTEELAKILHLKVLNKKITISGGEPLLQSEALLELVKKLKDFDIAVYTGHKLEEVPKELLENIKYIKTGSFIEEKMTTVNPYVGSSNQQFRRLR
ncbi:MAG: radical SAM protein [Clostridia bacterium]|nr:radical SAM protein [Clostridia bacterium]